MGVSTNHVNNPMHKNSASHMDAGKWATVPRRYAALMAFREYNVGAEFLVDGSTSKEHDDSENHEGEHRTSDTIYMFRSSVR